MGKGKNSNKKKGNNIGSHQSLQKYKKSKTKFEFLNISQEDKDLINKLSPDSELFYLAPLDKGLSGSVTLLAKWYIGSTGRDTKFHVLKIGDARKLEWELNAINVIAAPIIENFPNAIIKFSDDGKRAVLSQEFVGDKDGVNRSLKKFIEETEDLDLIEKVINSLYKEAIKKWIPDTSNETNKKRRISVVLNDILGDYTKKSSGTDGLIKAAEDIGLDAIEKSLSEHFNVDLNDIILFIEELGKEKLSIKRGPVHGDLHAQNVLLDVSNKISLIDFGWTAVRWQAIDFIWLECSLKFVVCLPHIELKDYISMEQTLFDYWGKEKKIPYKDIEKLYYGKEITKIMKCISCIRENAREFQVVKNKEEYIKGLIMMSSSLSTYPKLNRGTLIHSLATNITNMGSKKVDSIGAYDVLYQNSHEYLWPEIAGRMVKKAVEKCKTPGKCIDLGCGDGKNMVFLEKLGWEVIGIDISKIAISQARNRFQKNDIKMKGELSTKNVVDYKYPTEAFDLVVCYGLYHCLTDEQIEKIHKPIINSLKKGGLLAFATLNDLLQIPENHRTGDIYLRNERHIFDITGNDLKILDQEIGEIEEEHLPLVGTHKHSLTWVLYEKQ